MTTDDVADAIDAVGERIILRRVTSGGRFVSVQTRARMDTPPAQSNTLPGGAAQFHQQFRIHNRDITARRWPAPPRRGDQIVTQGPGPCRISTVQSVDTLKLGDDVASYVLQTVGSP